MKQKMKKVLSLVLSVVLAVTGLTITPPATADVSAEMKTEITSNKDGNIGKVTYYWQGESFELSFTSTTTTLDIGKGITVSRILENGESVNAQDQLHELNVTSTESESHANAMDYKVSVTLKDDAERGAYTFAVQDGSTKIEKQINVYESDCFVPSPIYTNGTFYNNPSKSFTETFVYSNVARTRNDNCDVEFNFTDMSGKSVEKYIDVQVSAADISRNKGCATYDVTVTPTRMLDEQGAPMIPEGGMDLQLHVKYKDHNKAEKEEVINYKILQSATKISEIKLLDCFKADAEYTGGAYYGIGKKAFISEYPHYQDGNIYMDADETVYFMFELENGFDDSFTNLTVKPTADEWEKMFDYSELKEPDEYGFMYKSGVGYVNIGEDVYYVLKLTAKTNATTAGRTDNIQVTFNTKSASISTTYNIFIYGTTMGENGKNEPKLEIRQIYSNGLNSNWSDANKIAMIFDPYNQTGTYQFRVMGVDKKEQLIYSSDITSIGSFSGGTATGPANNNNLMYPCESPATFNVVGTGTTGRIVAKTAKTLTRPEGAYSVSVSDYIVGELVLPEPGMFKIQKNNKDFLSDSVSTKSSVTYSLYSWGKKDAGRGEPAVATYSGYKWESSDKSVATVDDKGVVTALKQGTTQITVRTNYGGNYSREDLVTDSITLNVYSPISNLSIWNIGEESCKETIVAGREYTFIANKTDATGEKSTQEVQWQIADTRNAVIVKDNEGNTASSTEWVNGDTCKVKVNELGESETATVTLKCRTTDETTAAKSVTMTIVPEIKAKNVYIDYANNTSLRSNVGSTKEIKAVQYADDAKTIKSNEKLIWTSSAPDKVSVKGSEDGSRAELTFVSLGDAVITVANEDGTVSATVNVATIEKATNIDVTGSNGNYITSAEPVVLTATLKPETATDPIEWTVTPENAVTFETVSNGVVRAIADSSLTAGTQVKVTAKAIDSGLFREYTLTVKKSAKDFVVTGMPSSFEYTGSAITPHKLHGFAVTCDGNVLTENRDYTISITDGTNPYVTSMNVGTYKLSIKGIGNYTGTKEIEFNIVPKSISTAAVKINNDNNYVYTGEEIKLNPGYGVMVSLELGGYQRALTANDYDITCVNNVNAGTATATIIGKGNFTGTIVKTFVIEPKDVSRLTMTMESTNVEYTGEAVCPAVVVKDGTKELKVRTDYTVAYSNNVETGNYTDRPTVTITGIGNYTGTKTSNFSITAQKLTEDNIKLSKTDYTYNGKNCKPKVTVRNSNGKKLKVDVDYTITYPVDMTNIGIKNIIINGKGNYTGNVTVEYGIAEKVTVKKASIKKVKNSKAKTVTFEAKKVSGADGYEISYSTTKKFTKDTTKVVTSKKPKKTIKKLQKGKTYYFKVRAYKKNSIGRTIYGKASSVKKVKIKK